MKHVECATSGAAGTTALYDQHAPALLAYFLKRAASREDAEDLLLEVFLAAVEDGGLTQCEAAQQQAWLWAVARHKATDYYRRQGRQHPADFHQLVEAFSAAEDSQPEQRLLRQEELAHLAAAIERLPALQQEVLRLRFAHGLRYAAIALLLGKRESTVRTLLSRTLSTLRTVYHRSES